MCGIVGIDVNFNLEVRMDRKSILIVENPLLAQTLPGDEDSLLSKETSELAEYLSRHLGYQKLSRTQTERKTERANESVAIQQEYSLVQALQTAEISTFSLDSVKKYKESMIRYGWMKFILDPNKCALWVNLYFLMPAIAAVMFLSGWLNGWQSVLLAVAFQLPSSGEILRGTRLSNTKELFGTLLLVLSPILGLILAVSGFGKVWLGATLGVAVLALLCFFPEFMGQLRNSEIQWVRVPIGPYNKEIPIYVLRKMRQIHQLCPSTEFFVEELQADIYLPDPFLVAKNGARGQDFYIEVWDEHAFEAKHT